MSNPDQQLPAHWQYFADRSRETDLGYADGYGQGREELLHETLFFIESGAPFTDEVRSRLDRVPHNRAKKHYRLCLYLRTLARRAESVYLAGPDDAVGQLVDQIRETMSPIEWGIECRLAEGETYIDIADDVSPDALKMRVSRWRARVRENVAV